MTCTTPKKDDAAAGKCCGRGCHGKDFKDASTPKPDAAPQIPAETTPPASDGGCGPDKTGPDCTP